MEEVLEHRLALLVRCLQAQDGDIRLSRRIDDLAVLSGDLGVDALDVELAARARAAAPSAVGAIRFVSTVIDARCAASPAARKSARPTIASAASSSTNGFSKRPSTNFSRSRRRAETSSRSSVTEPSATSSSSSSGQCLAAELVGAGLEDLEHALARREVLDAPGPRGERLADDRRVVDEAPVGADDAVEAVALAQQAR